MAEKPLIVLTGGGTAGHIWPNLVLADTLTRNGYLLAYIGSFRGIERALVTEKALPYFPTFTGKLRRYLSWQNVADMGWVVLGILTSVFWLFRLRPTLVFSKGGFVALPTVIAAWLLRIPLICHESDLSAGLTTKISARFSRLIAVTFPQTRELWPEKAVWTGLPIRSSILNGNAARARVQFHLPIGMPLVLVVGGSLGSAFLNRLLREALPELTTQFGVVHLCGKGGMDSALQFLHYFQFEFINAEFGDLLAAADVVVSRAGSNSVYELLAVGKPHVLIPLSKRVSRGDQVENAQYYEAKGVSTVIDEEKATPQRLADAVQTVFNKRDRIRQAILDLGVTDGTPRLVSLIDSVLSRKTV
jgi:UDP-N-acetylglucosamine--N-acetylmuramyl-(pentapeptide) pyrophosphoryl-undecaprenol N-acetylglucosamine transferase